MRRLVATLLTTGLAVALAGCTMPQEGSSTHSPKDLSSLAAQQDQPLLALADHVLGGYFASDVVSQPTVCLAVHDGREEAALPPEDERALMMRYVRLSPMSRCVRQGPSLIDGETREPALLFQLHSFTCADSEHCTGFSGYEAGDQQSPTSLYRMTWDGAAWQFQRDQRLLGDQ